MNKIGVIGAGNMGSGIAQKLAQEGFNVVMIDTEQKFVQNGLNRIKTLLDEGVKRKIFTPQKVDKIISSITASTDYNLVKDADIIIEAIFEDKKVKEDLFIKLDALCDKKTILATNTSSFYVKDFSDKISRPDKFIGMHYFFHPAKNRLLEIIPAEQTSKDTIDQVMLASKLHGKTAIIVKDAPGFAVNRFFVPFLNEAARMLQEKIADIPTIEEAAKRAFKIGMGPFLLMNVTGIPIAYHAASTLGKEIGDFYAPAKILKAQMGKNQNWNIEGDFDESKIKEVADRFYGVCLGVAAALVDEKVASIEDTDRGAKIGLRWRLGPFEIMNKIGIDKTYKAVKAICEKYPDFNMPKILEKQKQLAKPFDFKAVDLKIKNNIAYITINRPEAMNALNEAVFKQLEENFNKAEQNENVKAIAFDGAGKAFIAGADIRFFIKKIKKNRIRDIYEFTKKGHNLLLQIENCKKPTITILDGLSMGGGSEFALATQFIIATNAGSMSFPETGIGIYPGLGGMLRLAKQIGADLAKYYIFTGAPLSAKDGLDLGIITEITTPQQIENSVQKISDKKISGKYRQRNIPEKYKQFAAAFSNQNIKLMLEQKPPQNIEKEIAEKILKILGYKAPLALKEADNIINAQTEKSVEEGIKIELDLLEKTFATKDALEGLSAAGRKRPEFTSS